MLRFTKYLISPMRYNNSILRHCSAVPKISTNPDLEKKLKILELEIDVSLIVFKTFLKTCTFNKSSFSCRL